MTGPVFDWFEPTVTDQATSISHDNVEGREGLIGLQEKKERDLHKYMQVRSCDLATPSYTPRGVYNGVYRNIQDDRVDSLATPKGVEDRVGKWELYKDAHSCT